MLEPHPYRRVLALVEFDAFDAAVVGRAHLLAQSSGAVLEVLHLIEPDSQFDGGYPGGGMRDYEAAALRRLRFLVASLGAEGAVCHAGYGPRRQTLARHLAQSTPDLIVTGEAHVWLEADCDTLILSSRVVSRGGRFLSALRAWLGLQQGAAGA